MSRIISGSLVELSWTCCRRDWREERKVSSSLALLVSEDVDDEVVDEEDAN